MAYIYQITNDINGKIYIGKTEFSIEKRFKEHCSDAFRERNEKRPLYAAMRKYGIEHFHIELLEETDNPEERETFWIEKKQSFKFGYNATLGGDGKKYLDYNFIISTYLQTQSIQDTAVKCNCSTDQVSFILKHNQIKTLTSEEVNKNKYGTYINQYDLNGKYLNTFASARDAFRSVRPNPKSYGGVSHITDVCKGKRQTAYGFKWRYAI